MIAFQGARIVVPAVACSTIFTSIHLYKEAIKLPHFLYPESVFFGSIDIEPLLFVNMVTLASPGRLLSCVNLINRVWVNVV